MPSLIPCFVNTYEDIIFLFVSGVNKGFNVTSLQLFFSFGFIPIFKLIFSSSLIFLTSFFSSNFNFFSKIFFLLILTCKLSFNSSDISSELILNLESSIINSFSSWINSFFLSFISSEDDDDEEEGS